MKNLTEESKKLIVQEVKAVGSISAVARKHKIPVSTLHAWVTKASKSKPSKKSGSKADREKLKALTKQLKEAQLENQILKDLIKKTNHAWLGE